MVGDLFTFCCHIVRWPAPSLLVLASAGYVMVLCWLGVLDYCCLGPLGEICLVCTVFWALRSFLGLVCAPVQWASPCEYGWAIHCLWVIDLL